MNQNQIEWLANGERGISSNTIFTHLTGVDALSGWSPSHPLDPADFLRCEKLLTQVPEFRDRLDEMETCSSEWKALVWNWEAIRKTLLSEIGDFSKATSWEAPKTYALMKEVLKNAGKWG